MLDIIDGVLQRSSDTSKTISSSDHSTGTLLVDERSFLLHFFGYSEATRVLEKILSITGGRDSSCLISPWPEILTTVESIRTRLEIRTACFSARFTDGSSRLDKTLETLEMSNLSIS